MLREIKLNIKRFLIVKLVALIVGLCAGCDWFAPEIHFILPNGYVGGFRIVLDELQGTDVQLKAGRYTYRIPERGELRVKTFEPFMTWHKVTAEYTDGKEIPSDDSNVKPEVIALRSGPGSGSREVDGKNVGPIILTYVVGTQEQLNSVKLPTFTNGVENPTPTPKR